MGVESAIGTYDSCCVLDADTVIAYITHNDRLNLSSASSRHSAKQKPTTFDFGWTPLRELAALPDPLAGFKEDYF